MNDITDETRALARKVDVSDLPQVWREVGETTTPDRAAIYNSLADDLEMVLKNSRKMEYKTVYKPQIITNYRQYESELNRYGEAGYILVSEAENHLIFMRTKQP